MELCTTIPVITVGREPFVQDRERANDGQLAGGHIFIY